MIRIFGQGPSSGIELNYCSVNGREHVDFTVYETAGSLPTFTFVNWRGNSDGITYGVRRTTELALYCDGDRLSDGRREAFLLRCAIARNGTECVALRCACV